MENQRPKTIEELKVFCADRGMPLEKMRFFIGEDFREPRAFGIYREEGDRFVVYKNKADGSRAVRYHGPDEAYAVKEIYEKLLSEIELRQNGKSGSTWTKKDTRGCLTIILACVLILAVIIILFNWVHRNEPRGYYHRANQTYYYDYSNWYIYDDIADDWAIWEDAEDWTDEPLEYYLSDNYDDSYDVSNVRDSDIYQSEHESSSSGSSSAFDSWDSNDTNWNSDW